MKVTGSNRPDLAGWMALFADGYALEVRKDGPLWRAAQEQYCGHGLAVVPLVPLGDWHWLIYLSMHDCRPPTKRLPRHDCYERCGRIVVRVGGAR